MYRKLLASTALALVVTGGAYAQMAPDPMAPAEPAPVETPAQELVTAQETGINADGWLATEIIGETIYNSTGDDAESIGEVNDFVLDQNGEIGAVVVGVGGFLGIGQKNVAINWEELELAQDMNGNNRLVANMTREQLESAAEFNRQEWLASESQSAEGVDAPPPADDPMAPAPADPMAPAPAPMEPAAPAPEPMAPAGPVEDAPAPADDVDAAPDEDAAAAPAEDAGVAEDAPAVEDAAPDEAATPDEAPGPDAPVTEAPAPDAAPASPEAEATLDAAVTEEAPAADADVDAGALDFDSFEQVEVADITADELSGTTVFGAGDEEIGSIGDIILTEDGSVQAVIVDFGGFLGIGTKPVAVNYDSLSFLRDENGDLVLRTALTSEQLEAAPEYNEEAFTAAPEGNMLTVE